MVMFHNGTAPHHRIRKDKCHFATIAITLTIAHWTIVLQTTCAYSSIGRLPQAKALLNKLLMSSIPSSDLDREEQKNLKVWRDDIIASTRNTVAEEKATKQLEMWDYIQSALGPYYEAVYGFQESLKYKFSIASSQDQMPLHERILKAAYEESFPWLVSLAASTAASFAAHSMMPLEIGASAEVMFCLYCIQKAIFKFNPPTAPQPMLGSRDWNLIQDRMWSSYGTVASKRNFVMGYFYNAPIDRLRKEDALAFLAWVKFGTLYDFLAFESQQGLHDDLKRLEQELESSLPRRKPIIEPPLPIIRFNLEHFRFRHKPLPFYGVTHGVNALLSWALPQFHGFSYHPPQGGSHNGLGYWYRPPSFKPTATSAVEQQARVPTPPLVFVHGVGGMCFYYGLIQELVDDTDGAIILLDLPFVSLQIADEIPTVWNQVQSIESILDQKFGPDSKVTFAGHSFGSVVLSWMVQAKPERVANCVFIDPVCFQQHLSKSLFNFHLQRVDKTAQEGKPWMNPISIGALMNLAGSEMHTNNAMLRHFWWNTNALWPEDLQEKGISTCVLLSEHDEIVPSREVHQLISEFNNDRGYKSFSCFEDFIPDKDDANKIFVRSFEVSGAHHGELLFSAKHRKKVIQTISSMLRLKNY